MQNLTVSSHFILIIKKMSCDQQIFVSLYIFEIPQATNYDIGCAQSLKINNKGTYNVLAARVILTLVYTLTFIRTRTCE
jgi:hypothetical protein